MGKRKSDQRQLSLRAAFGQAFGPSASSRNDREAFIDLNSEIVIEDGIFIQNEPVEEPKRKKDGYIRSFLPQWKLTYPWAFSIIDEEGNERVKCKVCSELKLNTPFASVGGKTIQKQALEIHHNSDAHKQAERELNRKKHAPLKIIEKHVDLMVDAEKNRIVSVIQIMWNIVQQNMPLDSFENACKFHMFMRTPNMPISIEYSSYISATSGRQFVNAMYLVYWEALKKEIRASPFYSLMIDESTDRRYAKHLIVYVTYLSNQGFGEPKTKFIRLIRIRDGKANSMFIGIKKLLEEMELNENKMVGFASDGASAIVGVNEGVVAKLRRTIPPLVGVHCIAHRENLVVKDTCEHFIEFVFLDKFANRVRDWLGDSTLRREELMDILDVFKIKHYEVLRIHGVRWLSRVAVLNRLVTIMPALLSQWKDKNEAMYSLGTIYQLQFLVHFLADVLVEVDLLNVKFQAEHMDITTIGRDINVLLNLLKDRYLGDYFGVDSKFLQQFLRKSRGGIYKVENKDGEVVQHVLKYESLPNSTNSGDISGSMLLAKDFIKKLIERFDERFADCHLFNSGKLFSPKHYPSERSDRGPFARQFMGWLCDRFAEGSFPHINRDSCETELARFVTTLVETYPTKGLFDTWAQCGKEMEWQMFPEMFKLWQIVLVLPASSVTCERGFSKQNLLKRQHRTCLCLETLDWLMFLTLSIKEELHDVKWDAIFDVWKSMKDRRPQNLSDQ